MTNQEAKEFTNYIFDQIKNSKTINDLEAIPDRSNILIQNRITIDGYPKIEFDIKPSEIQTLIDNNIIDKELNLSKDITSTLTDTLAKLLYATAWKNGDLKKIKHIIKGILDAKNNTDTQDDGLVFYQFGKYLTKTQGQPIIDQHVIRAFAIYKTNEKEKITTYRGLQILNKSHKPLINEYKKWLTSNEIAPELRDQKDFDYHIDKLLFATGKQIKFRKHTG